MHYFTLKNITLLSGCNKILGILAVLVGLLGCEESGIELSDTPQISLEAISHDTLVQYEEVLILTISYTDGDGDLGYPDPDRYSLFIRDVRLSDFDSFFVGPLAPMDSSVPIEGVIDVEFPSLFLFGNGASETTRFECRMVDRAGNESNLITTPSVVILKE